MSQERTNYSGGRRKWLDNLKEKKVLDFSDLDNKYIFFLALALGTTTTPKELKRAESWIQCNVYTIQEQALISSILLGKLCMDHKDINSQADFMTCNRYAEKCAEAGFDVLDQLVYSAKYDNEELCAEMIRKLDSLYNQNIRAADM